MTALESVAACVAGVAGQLAKESSEQNGQMTAIGKHDQKSLDQLTKVIAPRGEKVKHWADDLAEVAAQPRQVVASRQASEAPLALQAQPLLPHWEERELCPLGEPPVAGTSVWEQTEYWRPITVELKGWSPYGRHP